VDRPHPAGDLGEFRTHSPRIRPQLSNGSRYAKDETQVATSEFSSLRVWN
jgi:hypothetical protein